MVERMKTQLGDRYLCSMKAIVGEIYLLDGEGKLRGRQAEPWVSRSRNTLSTVQTWAWSVERIHLLEIKLQDKECVQAGIRFFGDTGLNSSSDCASAASCPGSHFLTFLKSRLVSWMELEKSWGEGWGAEPCWEEEGNTKGSQLL